MPLPFDLEKHRLKQLIAKKIKKLKDRAKITRKPNFPHKRGKEVLKMGCYGYGFGWRQLLIFLLVIATIFVFVGGVGY